MQHKKYFISVNPENFYLFTVRKVPSGWSRSLAVGDVIRMSKICNPSWRDNDDDSCYKYGYMGWCPVKSKFVNEDRTISDINIATESLFYATYNSSKHAFEIKLNCPQCGCTDTSMLMLTDSD